MLISLKEKIDMHLPNRNEIDTDFMLIETRKLNVQIPSKRGIKMHLVSQKYLDVSPVHQGRSGGSIIILGYLHILWFRKSRLQYGYENST